MDVELKQQPDWMNENLNTIVANQNMIHVELKRTEKMLGSEEIFKE